MLDIPTSEALRQAMTAAQAGQVKQARQLADRALANGGDVASLNAFLGMLLARGGDLPAAIPHLARAHDARPADVTIACNLIAALMETGDIQRALDTATHKLALADPSLRIAQYRGFAAQSLERFTEAVECYEYVVARAPEDSASWNNLGNARSALGDLEGSVVALQTAASLDPLSSPTLLNLAVALRALGEPKKSEAILLKMAEDFNDDARPLHELYVQYKLDGRQDDALPVLEKAVARDGDNTNLQLKFGIECGLVGRIDDAESAFQKVVELDPQISDAYLGLAIQYEHTNREEEFGPLIALAASNGVEEGPIAFLQALEHRRTKRFEQALQCLEQVPPDIEPERTAHLRGTVLDLLGRSDEAFAEFTKTNRLHQTASSDPLGRAATLRTQLRSELDFMTADWVSGWEKTEVARDIADPVFLVGFPRSGTTLLDTLLMGHPDTIVLEEKPALNLTEQRVGGLAAVPSMDFAAVEDARDFYFAEVEKFEQLDPAKLLVDKSPLFLSKAPLIHRLSPRARFILVIRHPCDVLLSCLMSNFRLNDAMSNFLRIEDAAEFYDLTFRHWERSRALLPLNVHMVQYERMIANVEAEMRPLFDFLGIDWHEAALDHQKTAKARGLITTASYSQVTEPIYTRSAGRWRRYRQHLEPVLPVLEPWVEKFGYTL